MGVRSFALGAMLVLAASLPDAALAQTIGPQGGGQPASPTYDVPAPKPASRSFFPIWADRAAERGVELPLPYGVGIAGVSDTQAVIGDHLSVRLAKGQAPSADVDLISITPVTFDNVGATKSAQIKADVWLFPFLNVFAAVGKVKGDISIDVVIDEDALLPPPICRPADPCGIKHLYFTTPLENTTTTFGATLGYGSDHWFLALTGTQTIAVADTDRSDIKSTDIGLRVGPRLRTHDWFRIAPYVGVDYTRMNTEVRGVASLDDAFPDGDGLYVRYDARVRNEDEKILIIGANAELGRHFDLQAEYGHSDGGDRIIVSTSYRF